MTTASTTEAQAGPPFLSNDAHTPGKENWEINLGVMPVLTADVKSVQIMQLDFNYGVGDRIQLTYEGPYVWQSSNDQPNATGWANSLQGVKWRFINGGKDGWNVSMFPQVETGGSSRSVANGIAREGTRFLQSFQVTKKVGLLDVNAEGGYFFPLNSSASKNERILGFVVGHEFNSGFEAVGEIYDDKVMGDPEHNTTFELGGRYQFHKGLLLLFMAGRSFRGNSSGQPEFLGYAGIRILLDHNGKKLHAQE